MRNLSRTEIKKAIAKDAWDLGNEVLYKLCSAHPFHKTKQEIIAKIWLIGRSYAAALERRKNKDDGPAGDLFYEDKVVSEIKASQIDTWLVLLKNTSKPESIIETHSKLTELFYSISELEKRSLASKYLHFHRPNLFFIFDSRAMKAIRKITPSASNQLPDLSPSEFDKEYMRFYRRCLWLQSDLQNRIGISLSPRQIDKVLLFVADGGK